MDEDPNKVEKNTKPNESENPETGSETKKKDIQEWIKVWKEKEQKKKEEAPIEFVFFITLLFILPSSEKIRCIK